LPFWWNSYDTQLLTNTSEIFDKYCILSSPARALAPVDALFRHEQLEVVRRSPDHPSVFYDPGPAELSPDSGDEANDDTSKFIKTHSPIIPILPEPIQHLPLTTTSANPMPKRKHYLPLGPGPRIIEGEHDGVPILPRGELASDSRLRHHLRPVHGPELPRPIATPLTHTDDFPIKQRDNEVHRPAYDIYMNKPKVPKPSVSSLPGTGALHVKERDVEVHQPKFEIYAARPKLPTHSVSPLPYGDAVSVKERDIEVHKPAYEVFAMKAKVPTTPTSSLPGTHGVSFEKRELEFHQPASNVFIKDYENSDATLQGSFPFHLPAVPLGAPFGIKPHFEPRSASKDKASLKSPSELRHGHGLPQAHAGISEVLRRTAVQDGDSLPAGNPDLKTPDMQDKAAVQDRATHLYEWDPQNNHLSTTVDDTIVPLNPNTIGNTEEDEFLEQLAGRIQIPYAEKPLQSLQPARALLRRATPTLPTTDSRLKARNDLAQADVFTHQPVGSLYRRHHIIKPTAVPGYDPEYDMGPKDDPFEGPIVPGLRGPGPAILTPHGPFLPKNLPRDSNDDGNEEHHHSGHHSKQHNDEKSETSNSPHKDSTGNLENNDKYSHSPNGDPISQLPAWQYQVENSVFGHVQNKREANPDHDSDRHEKDENDRKERGGGSDHHEGGADKKNDPDTRLTVPPNQKMPATALRPLDALWLQTVKHDKREARPIPPPDFLEEKAPPIVKDHGRMHVPLRTHHPTPEDGIVNQRQKDPGEEKRTPRPAYFVPLEKTSATPAVASASRPDVFRRDQGDISNQIAATQHDSTFRDVSPLKRSAWLPKAFTFAAPATFHETQDEVRRRNTDYKRAATPDQDLSESVYNQRSVSRVWRHAQRDGLFSVYP
jgi:hypothetical protein